jgi:glycosyltransferase involved in cell wall biosynthesis
MRLGASVTGKNRAGGLPAGASETLAWARQGSSILMVGTIEPRKGHHQVLASFEELWANPNADEDFRLVVVGRPGWKTEALQHRLRNHRMAGGHVRWIEDASDEYLEQLYEACWGVVLASHGEGFGLPVLEAAARNKPLLLRDLPVFREVAPPGAVFFGDDTPGGLAAIIRRWRQHGTPVKIDPADLCWETAAGDLRSKLEHLASCNAA